MKTRDLLATLFAATLSLSAVPAEGAGKTETETETTEMKGAGMIQMMSNSKDQDAVLDRLVAETNSASAEKKLDAIAAALTKLVEQRNAMHEQMREMMSANMKGVCMCGMMSCSHNGEDSHH